jgi:transglutaminase-like putative cysteine protease
MEIHYELSVGRCFYTIKCLPPDTDRQKITDCHIEMMPDTRWNEGTDAFGNRKIYGSMDIPHDRFFIRVVGEARTGLADSDGIRQKNLLGLFRYPYGLTRPGESLAAYETRLSETSGFWEMSPQEKSLFLMHQLHRDFQYRQGVTDVATPAEMAWKMGQGVCQDYAHILIVLCRRFGIPARYVAGMMVGEGHSHAWVEVLCGDRWYGLDPTNDCVVDDGYIVIGTGRDASDCALNRGIILGGGQQRQSVSVIVNRLGE